MCGKFNTFVQIDSVILQFALWKCYFEYKYYPL